MRSILRFAVLVVLVLWATVHAAHACDYGVSQFRAPVQQFSQPAYVVQPAMQAQQAYFSQPQALALPAQSGYCNNGGGAAAFILPAQQGQPGFFKQKSKTIQRSGRRR